MYSDVRGFKVTMNYLLATEVVLGLEDLVNYLLGFNLREDASLFDELLQIKVAVLQKQIVFLANMIGCLTQKLHNIF